VRAISEERFAGVDWASDEHAICAVDEHGRIVEGRTTRPGSRRVEPAISFCRQLVGIVER